MHDALLKKEFASFEEVIKYINKNIDFLDVIEKLDIKVDFKFYKSNTQVMINCPFHYDLDPSLSISLEDNIYHCFSCSASGTLFTFVRKYLNADFIDTLTWFMHYYFNDSIIVDNYEYNPLKISFLLNFISNFHMVANNLFLQNKNNAIKFTKDTMIGKRFNSSNFRDILENFGVIDKDAFDKFNFINSFDMLYLMLNFNENIYNRLGFPENIEFIFDKYLFMPVYYKKIKNRRIVSYIMRYIENDDKEEDKKMPKYLSAKESLFKFSYIKFGGMDTVDFIKYYKLLQLDEINNRTIFMLEGIFDYYAFKIKYGIEKNIVFIAGTHSIKEEDLELLTNQFGRYVLLFDFDEAGQKLYDELKKILLSKNKVVIIPDIEKFKYTNTSIRFANIDFKRDMLIFSPKKHEKDKK